MSAVGLESIEHTVHVTHTWINELDNGWAGITSRGPIDCSGAVAGLRDWLPVNEAADFAAQLPNLLRGVYYEQWRPATTPVKPRSKSDFLGRIDHAFVGDPILHTEDAVRITLRFLSTKIAAGEIADVKHALPADLRALWTLSSAAA